MRGMPSREPSRLPDAKEATTKTSSLSGAGAAQLFNNLKLLSNSNTAYRTHLRPSPFDSAPIP